MIRVSAEVEMRVETMTLVIEFCKVYVSAK